MMFFQDGQYPKLANYLRTQIIDMDRKSQVFKALAKCIGNRKLAKQAIAAGTYPRLIIQPLVHGNAIISGAYQGECKPETVNYVYVHTRIADGFEIAEQEYPTIFEKVLLHEVVHWGRFVGGKPGEIFGKEAGNWFTHLAYNEPYSHHSDLPCP